MILKKILIIVMLIFFLFLLVIVGIEELTKEEVGIKKVDCYDIYENKIDGLQCNEIIYCGIMAEFFYKEDCRKIK